MYQNEEFNTEIDDILSNLGKKKKGVNSSRKGKRSEGDLCKLLVDRFDKPFVRNPDSFGSGGWSTNNQDFHQDLDLEHMAGDIITPKGFKFAIESKCGYNLEVINFFPGAQRKRDLQTFIEFVQQAERDADRVGKEPLLIYKKDRCPYLAGIRSEAVPQVELNPKFTLIIMEKPYTILGLSDFLSLEDSFFFV